MKAEDVLPFLNRDWSRVERAKLRYWRDRKRRMGRLEGVVVSDDLRKQVLAMHPEWPSAADRTEDLRAHVQLSDRMRRIDDALGR